MSLSNTISVGYANPVEIDIRCLTDQDGNPITLLDLEKVTAKFGNDERNSVDNPNSVVIASEYRLELYFGDTTETQSNFWVISATYDDNEYILTSECLANLDRTKVCT